MPGLATQQTRKPDAENVGHRSKAEALLCLLMSCPKHSLSRILVLTTSFTSSCRVLLYVQKLWQMPGTCLPSIQTRHNPTLSFSSAQCCSMGNDTCCNKAGAMPAEHQCNDNLGAKAQRLCSSLTWAMQPKQAAPHCRQQHKHCQPLACSKCWSCIATL